LKAAFAVVFAGLAVLLLDPRAVLAAVAVGEPIDAAPAIPVLDIKGEPADLRTLLQPPGATLLIFWATWCQPCIHEVPEIRELSRFYASRGLRVMSVALSWNGDTLEKVVEARQTHGIDYPVYFDAHDKARPAFDLRALPASVLIDSTGVVRWKGNLLPSDINARIKEALGPGEERGSK